MIPLKDHIRTRSWPIVTWLLISANILVFLYELSLPNWQLEALVQRWGVTPAALLSYLFGPEDNPGVLVTVVTSMFIHGGWVHLLSNMLYLWIFGDNVEDALGHIGYLVFYLLAGAAAASVQAFLAPDPYVPAIGASGAIAGVLGAYLVLFPGATVAVLLPWFFVVSVVDVPAVIMLVIWFLSQFMGGLASIINNYQAASAVAWWAHVGGFLAGILLLPFFPRRRKGYRSRYRR